MTIGEAIQRRRERLGYTRPRAAAILAEHGADVSAEMLRHWEAGRTPVRVDDLGALAKMLRTSVPQLLRDGGVS